MINIYLHSFSYLLYIQEILKSRGFAKLSKPREGARCMSCLLNHPGEHSSCWCDQQYDRRWCRHIWNLISVVLALKQNQSFMLCFGTLDGSEYCNTTEKIDKHPIIARKLIIVCTNMALWVWGSLPLKSATAWYCKHRWPLLSFGSV